MSIQSSFNQMLAVSAGLTALNPDIQENAAVRRERTALNKYEATTNKVIRGLTEDVTPTPGMVEEAEKIYSENAAEIRERRKDLALRSGNQKDIHDYARRAYKFGKQYGTGYYDTEDEHIGRGGEEEATQSYMQTVNTRAEQNKQRDLRKAILSAKNSTKALKKLKTMAQEDDE